MPEGTSAPSLSALQPTRKAWIAGWLAFRVACNDLDGPVLEAVTSLQPHGTAVLWALKPA